MGWNSVLRGEGWRLLQAGSSSMTYDDDDVWTPLEAGDYAHLGITISYQIVVLLIVVHLWLCREWPPYIPRQISLVCMTGVAGVIAYCGALIAYGVVRRSEGDFLASCAVEGLLDYTGWGVWMSVALVRVYRSWKILVRHSVDMYPAWRQVLLISTPWLLPVVAYSINPSLAEYNERGNWCDINVPIDTALYIYGCVPIFGAFVLVYQMRMVRKQMNFYRMQVFQLVFLLMTGTVVFPLLEGWLETRDDIRRTWIMYDNVVSSLILFWPPIAMPIFNYITGNEDYLHSYTKGFSTLPTPMEMRSSLKDQLSLVELRKEFEKFADSKIARELPDFYKACLDREEINDFFERQACTTAIIDRFIRIGSEQEVNLNGVIRQKILVTEITSYNIFNEAMTAVLKMMDTNFSAEFKESEAFKNLEKVVEQEAEELERLRQMKQLPPKDHVEKDPRGLLRFLRKVTESVGTKSSKEGTESRCSGGTHSSSGRHNKCDTDGGDEQVALDELYDSNGALRNGPGQARHDSQTHGALRSEPSEEVKCEESSEDFATTLPRGRGNSAEGGGGRSREDGGDGHGSSQLHLHHCYEDQADSGQFQGTHPPPQGGQGTQPHMSPPVPIPRTHINNKNVDFSEDFPPTSPLTTGSMTATTRTAAAAAAAAAATATAAPPPPLASTASAAAAAAPTGPEDIETGALGAEGGGRG